MSRACIRISSLNHVTRRVRELLGIKVRTISEINGRGKRGTRILVSLRKLYDNVYELRQRDKKLVLYEAGFLKLCPGIE